MSVDWKQKLPDTAAAAAVLGILGMMIVPVPTGLIDLLLIMNLSMGLIVLMVTLYVRQPLQFSVFPTILLYTTLMRLALNVASTRAILLNGYGGKVIESFGQFVVGGNTAVGLVVFLILAVIQFVVITKGAGRIAEVAARFTLDAMPGRQMAIDADLNAGIIDEVEAKERREELTKLSDFYGAMDGASKFVRGDTIAGVVITVINILGGFAVGVAQLGMSLTEALQTFTILTVGDGLVASLPALIISTASGILVTRAQEASDLSRQIGGQLASDPRVFSVSAGVLMILALVPGLPFLPFMVVAVGLFALSRVASKALRRREEVRAAEAEAAAAPAEGPEKVEKLLKVDPMEIELGYALIPLVEEAEGGDLLRRVTLVRRQSALEIGVVVPPVRIRDNVRLKPDTYAIKIRGMEVARGRVLMRHWLAMNPGNVKTRIKGIETEDPVFHLPSVWIADEERSGAELAGYTVVEPAAVVATHLSEVVKRHGDELLGRQEVQALLDNVKADFSVVIDELVPQQMTLGGVQKVLRRLLREQVSVRDLGRILEVLADHAAQQPSEILLTERVRQALGRTIAERYLSDRGVLQGVTLDLELERRLLTSLVTQERDPRLVLQPDLTQKLLDGAGEALKACLAVSEHPVFICTQGVRPHLYELLSRVFPDVVVLSYQEVEGVESIRSVTTLRLDDASQEILLAHGA